MSEEDIRKMILGEVCPKGHTKIKKRVETSEDKTSGKAFFECLECGLEWTVEAKFSDKEEDDDQEP